MNDGPQSSPKVDTCNAATVVSVPMYEGNNRLNGTGVIEASLHGVLQSGHGRVRSARAGYTGRGKNFSGRAEWIQIDGFAKGGPETVFRIQDDDSMAPSIDAGDYLLCTKINVGDLHSGNIAILETADSRFVKRVQFADGAILLQSDNAAHKIYKIESEDILAAWRVERKLSLADLQALSDDFDSLAYLERDIIQLKRQLEELKGKLGKE